MNTVTLKKAIKKDGNEISELNLDFDRITGNEILSAEKETRLLGDNTPDVVTVKRFRRF